MKVFPLSCVFWRRRCLISRKHYGKNWAFKASGQSALAQADKESIGDTEVLIVVQVNGKRRAQTEAAATASAKEIETIAANCPLWRAIWP